MIGHRRKRSNVWNLMILIGRGLDYSGAKGRREKRTQNEERRTQNEMRSEKKTFYILHSTFCIRKARCLSIEINKYNKGQTMNLPLCSCQGAQAPPQRREAERAEKLRKSFRTSRRNEQASREGKPAGRQPPRTATTSFTISGGNDEGVPPVPIPNTEVKPFSAESTWLDTAREHRSPPDSLIPQ